jgi:hypothetical protein
VIGRDARDEARMARAAKLFASVTGLTGARPGADGAFTPRQTRAMVELLIDGIASIAVITPDPGAALRWARDRIDELASSADKLRVGGAS